MVMTPVMTTKNDNNELQWQWSWQWWQYKLMIWKIFIKIHRLYFQSDTHTSHQKKHTRFWNKNISWANRPSHQRLPRLFSRGSPSSVGWLTGRATAYHEVRHRKTRGATRSRKTADSQWMILVLVKGPQTKAFGLYLVYRVIIYYLITTLYVRPRIILWDNVSCQIPTSSTIFVKERVK